MISISLLIVLISFIIAISYPLIISLKYGIQQSISDSFYVKKVGYWFTFWCWSFSIPLLFFMNVAPLIFLCVASFVFLGAAANFRRSLSNDVHNISAGIGILAGFAVLSIYFSIILGVILLGTFLLTTILFKLLNIKNFIWWVEIVAIFLIYLGLIINHI